MVVNYFFVLILALSGCLFTDASDLSQAKVTNPSSTESVIAVQNPFVLKLSADKFYTISLNEPFDENKLDQLLPRGWGYRVQSGIAIVNKTLRKYYQISKDEELIATFYANEDKQIEKVEVFSPRVVTLDNVAVNSQLNKLYSSTQNLCRRKYDIATEIACKSPSTPTIQYIVTGHWNGSASLMPSDHVIAGWKIKRIIWLND